MCVPEVDTESVDAAGVGTALRLSVTLGCYVDGGGVVQSGHNDRVVHTHIPQTSSEWGWRVGGCLGVAESHSEDGEGDGHGTECDRPEHIRAGREVGE